MRYEGELCALCTACLWACSGTAFGFATRRVGGFATNQFRIYAAWPVLAAIALLTTGAWWPPRLGDERTALLLVSGAIGLVFGDIGYFHALARIGPRLAAVIMATWPIFALLTVPWTGEAVRQTAVPGVLVTVVGVVLVLLQRSSGAAWNPHLSRGQWWSGVAGALVAALGQAVGIVLARRGMVADVTYPDGVPAFAAAFVRMTAGVAGMTLVAIVRRTPAAALLVFGSREGLAGALVGAACGPVLGVACSMFAAQRSASVGIASALMATTPLFMVPIARVAYGARVGPLGWLGTLLTVGGAAMLLVDAG